MTFTAEDYDTAKLVIAEAITKAESLDDGETLRRAYALVCGSYSKDRCATCGNPCTDELCYGPNRFCSKRCQNDWLDRRLMDRISADDKEHHSLLRGFKALPSSAEGGG